MSSATGKDPLAREIVIKTPAIADRLGVGTKQASSTESDTNGEFLLPRGQTPQTTGNRCLEIMENY